MCDAVLPGVSPWIKSAQGLLCAIDISPRFLGVGKKGDERRSFELNYILLKGLAMAAEELQTLQPYMTPCRSTAPAHCSTANCTGTELLSKLHSAQEYIHAPLRNTSSNMQTYVLCPGRADLCVYTWKLGGGFRFFWKRIHNFHTTEWYRLSISRKGYFKKWRIPASEVQ